MTQPTRREIEQARDKLRLIFADYYLREILPDGKSLIETLEMYSKCLEAMLAQEPVAVRYQLPVGQGFFYSDFPPHVSLEITAPHQLLYAMPVAPQDGEATNPWKAAVIDALVSNFIYETVHQDNPRKAIADLIAWEQKIALDPAVSAEARALIARGRSASKDDTV